MGTSLVLSLLMLWLRLDCLIQPRSHAGLFIKSLLVPDPALLGEDGTAADGRDICPDLLVRAGAIRLLPSGETPGATGLDPEGALCGGTGVAA